MARDARGGAAGRPVHVSVRDVRPACVWLEVSGTYRSACEESSDVWIVREGGGERIREQSV